MMERLNTARLRLMRNLEDEAGAVGLLIVGVLLGIGLVLFGIIKFLIPGE